MKKNIKISYSFFKMSTLLSQVTCSLRNVKIDESKWEEHLVSNSHFIPCRQNKDKNTIRLFEKISKACLEKIKIYVLEI